jgi:hypothetical protein
MEGMHSTYKSWAMKLKLEYVCRDTFEKIVKGCRITVRAGDKFDAKDLIKLHAKLKELQDKLLNGTPETMLEELQEEIEK